MNLHIAGEAIESLLYYDSKPVLELKIYYPLIMGYISQKSENAFNNFYYDNAHALNRKARNEIYPMAVAEYKRAKEEGYSFNLFSYLRTYTITRLSEKYTSLFLELYEYSGGAHGMTTRFGNTWNFLTGNIVPLSYFFNKNKNYRRVFIQTIQEYIRNDEPIYFENPTQRAVLYFDEKNYYMDEDSFVIFYPLYTLAPFAAGILSYKIPFEALNGYYIKGREPKTIQRPKQP